MIRTKLKLWCALGVSSAAALSASADEPRTSKDEFAGGTLAHALDKIFEGEGGEGGLGFTSMRRSFSVPALTGSQLQQVFAGNTLGQHRWLSMYLQPDGTASGWHGYFKEIERSRCPQQDTDGDGLHLDANRCMQLTFANYQGAKWSVQDDKLCIPNIEGKSGNSCYYAALVLNNVALFDESGKMIGKGKDLAKGNRVSQPPER